MPYKMADRIFETGNCAGALGNVILLGAFSGLYKAFASFMSEGDTTTILIESTVANEAELCDATLTGGQLVRGSLLWSTNVDNSRVAFVPGVKRVMMSDTIARVITAAGGAITGPLSVAGQFDFQIGFGQWLELAGAGASAGYSLRSTDAPLNQKNWQVYPNVDGLLHLEANTDDWSGVQAQWKFGRDGSIVMDAPTSPASGWIPWTQSVAGREVATLGIYTDGNADSWHAELSTYAFASGNYGSGVNMAMARGTVLAPLTVQDGDNVAFVYARAWDGATWQPMPELDWFVDGTPGVGGVMPSRVRLNMKGGTLGNWDAFNFRASGDSYFGKDGAIHVDPAGSVDLKYITARWYSAQSVGSDGGGIDFQRTDAAAGLKNWQVYAQADGKLKLIANNDDWSVEQAAWTFDRVGAISVTAPTAPDAPPVYPGFNLQTDAAIPAGKYLFNLYGWTFGAMAPGSYVSELDLGAFIGAGTTAAGTYGAGIWAYAFRGTPDAPTTLGDGDQITWHAVSGWDGAQLRAGPSINFDVMGTPGVDGLMPVRVSLQMWGAGGWTGGDRAWDVQPDGNSYFGKGGAIHVDAAGAVWIIDSSNLTAPWLDIITTTQPGMSFQATANGANLKNWELLQQGDGTLRFEAYTDAWGLQSAFVFARDGSMAMAGTLYAAAHTAGGAVNPAFAWDNTGNAVDLRKWDFFEWSDGNVYIRAITDAGVMQTQFEFSRDGVFHAPFVETTTLAPGNNTTLAATTAFVTAAIAAGGGGAPSGPAGGALTGTYPNPTLVGGPLSNYAPLASPVFTGNPTAPTASPGDNDTSLSTTAFVAAAIAAAIVGLAPLAAPAFTGNPTAPTPAAADNDTSIATTAFVQGELANYLTTAAAALKAPLASPTFTGNPLAPTPSPGDNDTSIATTAFVTAAIAAGAYAPLASPVFTGNPTGPTASPGDNDTSLATTAFVAAAAALKADLASPTFTGNPLAPTPAAGDNDTSIATTAFVQAELGYLGQTIQAGNYTTVQGDAGGSVYHASGAGAAAYTIPANATLAYLLGTTITFVNDSATAITIAVTTDTLAWSPAGTTGTRTLAQNGVATVYKATSTRWLISGTGLT